MQRTHIPRIVVTGGPCAGKTTAMAKMTQVCANHGFHPLVVPEAATTLISNGMSPANPGFQRAVFDHVLYMEELFDRAAKNYENAVLLCDRGIYDQRAYMSSDEEFKRLFNFQDGMSPERFALHARDERYAGVIFLRSAANGAEAFYSNESNESRYENLEEARALDERTLQAWQGTPHISIIANKAGYSFEQKIFEATQSLARILGVPEPLEIERKFQLLDFKIESLPSGAVPIDIVQTYLVGKPGTAERVRARGQNNQWIYFHTIKEPRGDGSTIERERIISKHEYDALLVRKDQSLTSIHKTRYCFAFKDKYCELDVFKGHKDGLVILEIELSDLKQEVELPPFLDCVEVTDDPDFSNYNLAQVA